MLRHSESRLGLLKAVDDAISSPRGLRYIVHSQFKPIVSSGCLRFLSVSLQRRLSLK
jgi:hypothetical protein